MWLYSFCHFDNRNSSESFISDGMLAWVKKTRSEGFSRWHISWGFWLMVRTRKGKSRVGGESASDGIAFRFFCHFRKLCLRFNRKTECPFQTGFGITIGDIWENNRRYFQNIRTFSVNAYVFSAKCLLLFAKSQAFRARKPVFSASKVSIWLFSSLRVSETDKDSVMKNRYLLSFCTVIRWTDVIRLDCSERTAGFVFRNGD